MTDFRHKPYQGQDEGRNVAGCLLALAVLVGIILIWLGTGRPLL
jgi:hypothetical protein